MDLSGRRSIKTAQAPLRAVIRPETAIQRQNSRKTPSSSNLPENPKKRPMTQQVNRSSLSNSSQQRQQDKNALVCDVFDKIMENSFNIPVHEAIEPKLCALFHAEKCVVWLNDLKIRILFSPTLNFYASYNDTLPGFVFRSGSVIQVRDPSHAPGGFEINPKITPPHTPQLIFPLSTNKGTRGVIQVIGRPHSLGFSERDSAACALFMKKMRIYGETIFNTNSIESIATNYFSPPQPIVTSASPAKANAQKKATFATADKMNQANYSNQAYYSNQGNSLEIMSKYFNVKVCELWRCDIVRGIAQILILDRHDTISYPFEEAGIVGAAASNGKAISCLKPSTHPSFNQKLDGSVEGAVLVVLMQLGDREVWSLALRGRDTLFSAIEEAEVNALVWFVVGSVAGFDLSPERSVYVTHLTELISVGREVISSLSLTKITNVVCDRACRLLECEEGFIHLLDHKKQNFAPFFGKPNQGTFPQKISAQKGICGLTVATLTPQSRMWPSEDPAYDFSIDTLPQVAPRSMLCVPIFDQSNEIIGVTVLQNKVRLGDFEEHDEKVLSALNIFAGIALSNSLKYRTFTKMTGRLRQFVETAMNTNLESELKPMLQRILTKIRSILSASRVSFFIVNNATDKLELFMNVGRENLYGDLFSEPLRKDHGSRPFIYGNEKVREMKANASIHEVVPVELLSNGTTPTISTKAFPNTNANQIFQSYPSQANPISGIFSADLLSTASTAANPTFQEIACVPLLNSEKSLLGILELETYEMLTEDDRSLIDSFAAVASMSLERIHLKELATFGYGQVELNDWIDPSEKELSTQIPAKLVLKEAENFETVDFNPLEYDGIGLLKIIFRIFYRFRLCEAFEITNAKLFLFLLEVRSSYYKVAYNNWRHAVDVTHFGMLLIISGNIEQILSPSEIFGFIVACICHDVGHNGYSIKTNLKQDVPLSILYQNHSAMESHHCATTIGILTDDKFNLFASLSEADYKEMWTNVIMLILATDMAKHFEILDRFALVIKLQKFEPQKEASHRFLLMEMLIKCADFAILSRPLQDPQKLTNQICEEFYQQGQLDRVSGLSFNKKRIDRNCLDRDNSQYGVFQNVCLPMFQVLEQMNQYFQIFSTRVLQNIETWRKARPPSRPTNFKLQDFGSPEEADPGSPEE